MGEPLSQDRTEHQEPRSGHQLSAQDDAVHVNGRLPPHPSLADDERARRLGRQPEACTPALLGPAFLVLSPFAPTGAPADLGGEDKDGSVLLKWLGENPSGVE
jgi:hypothetical protein